MSLSPPRSGRRTVAVAAAVTLLAALAVLASGGTPAHAAPANGPIPCSVRISATLHSSNPSRDMVVALPAPYTAEGTEPVMWSFLGGLNQRWCPQPVGSGALVLRNMVSGQCLTAAGPPKNGTPVNQQRCIGSSGSTYQQWKDQDVSGRVAFKNVATGGCLDIIGKNPKAGARLQIWGCSYAWNQTWWLGQNGK